MAKRGPTGRLGRPDGQGCLAKSDAKRFPVQRSGKPSTGAPWIPRFRGMTRIPPNQTAAS
ncbi:MAG: hypothetical protein MZU97_12060 [Bacillus subtilis]|nr:hypothetical protein [Bacillus subtilis]